MKAFPAYVLICIGLWVCACVDLIKPYKVVEASTLYEQIVTRDPKPFAAQEMSPDPDPAIFIEFAVDSCDLNFINSPNFRGYGSWYRAAAPAYVDVVFGNDRQTWTTGRLWPVIKSVLANNGVSGDSVSIDNTSLTADSMILDFNGYIINPSGQFEKTGGTPANRRLHLEWPGVRYYPMLQNEKSMLIGTNANNNELEVIAVIQLLPSLKKFSVFGAEMTDGMWGALLAECKAGFMIDARGQTVDQDWLDQAEYQQITVLQ